MIHSIDALMLICDKPVLPCFIITYAKNKLNGAPLTYRYWKRHCNRIGTSFTVCWRGVSRKSCWSTKSCSRQCQAGCEIHSQSARRHGEQIWTDALVTKATTAQHWMKAPARAVELMLPRVSFLWKHRLVFLPSRLLLTSTQWGELPERCADLIAWFVSWINSNDFVAELRLVRANICPFLIMKMFFIFCYAANIYCELLQMSVTP